MTFFPLDVFLSLFFIFVCLFAFLCFCLVALLCFLCFWCFLVLFCSCLNLFVKNNKFKTILITSFILLLTINRKIKLQFLSKNITNCLFGPTLDSFAQICLDENFPQRLVSISFWRLLTHSLMQKISKINEIFWDKLQRDRRTDRKTWVKS